MFPEVQNFGEPMRTASLGWDSHFEAAGHERWAQGLVEKIRDEHLLLDESIKHTNQQSHL